MEVQYANVRAHIFDLLGQVQTLLEEATCDGVQLAELACFADVNDKFEQLVATVDYYID